MKGFDYSFSLASICHSDLYPWLLEKGLKNKLEVTIGLNYNLSRVLDDIPINKVASMVFAISRC